MSQDYFYSEANSETIEDIRKELFETVQEEERHDFYDRTVSVYEKAYAYTSGEGLNKYLQRFQQRESEPLYKQRCELTKHIVPPIINNLTFLLNKVPRSSAMHLNYINEDLTRYEKLKEVDANYYADDTVQQFMMSKNILFDNMDANGWVIDEFESTDGSELAQPYPFIVHSPDAINYEYINGKLNYLIVRQEHDYIEGNSKKEGFIYTIYTPVQNIKIIPFYNATFAGLMQVDGMVRTFGEGNESIEVVRLKNVLYKIEQPDPHNIGWTPARRWGYKPDKVTYGETFVPFWWDAEPYLSKIIKINSELDITMARHNFPQKWQYVRKCTAPGCSNGQVLEGGGTCNVCHGSGILTHTSAQDAIELPLPDSKEEMIDLAGLVNYVYPPVDGMKFTNEKIQELVKDCKNSVFNSDIFSRQEIAETATSKVIDLQSIYDTLYPYAVNYANTWQFHIKTIAKITDTNEGLVVIAVVEKDFKFKTKEELIAERQAAENAGVNNGILKILDSEIMAAMLDERPSDLLAYQVQEKFNPFTGKPTEEIIAEMSSNNIPKRTKVFYANMGYIFDELFTADNNFYNLEPTKQRELINAKVDEIMLQLDSSPTLPDLTITE